MLYNHIIKFEEWLINQQSYLLCRTVYKMNKQPEITEQTRKNIIMAFCKLYEEKPIEKISVKEIIALAGYNRSTFYEYFTDIYALLKFIEDDVIDIHTSIKSFIYMLPKYVGHELTAEETKSVTSLYKAINIRANLAAMSSASKTRMTNSLVNLYDQTGLEELNNMLDSDDVLNLTDLNMNKVKIPKSYWNWDDTDWGQY